MANGWQKTLLGDILTERKETPSPERLETGEISIVSKIGFNKGEIELRSDGMTKTGMILIRPGDLVISGINATKGAIAIYESKDDKPIAATIHYGAYIPNRERVDIRFLWWYLRSAAFREIVQHHVPGGIKTELKAKRLLPIPIPLPLLDEQRRIANEIELLSVKVDSARKLRLSNVKELEFLGPKYFEELLAESSPDLKVLEQVLAEPLQNGLSIPASGIGDHGVLFAKVGIVNSGKMNIRETKRVDIDLDVDSSFWMKSGDIFISRGNSLELVGRAAQYQGKPERIAFPDLLIRIRVNCEVLVPQFLVHYLQTGSARKYIEAVASGTSPSMKKISQPKLKSMPIPLPQKIDQQRIVRHLRDMEAQLTSVRQLQAETEKELNALLPSVLDRAFKGEL